MAAVNREHKLHKKSEEPKQMDDVQGSGDETKILFGQRRRKARAEDFDPIDLPGEPLGDMIIRERQ